MVVWWRYRMPFDVNACVSTLMNVDWAKWIYFCVNEFEVGVNDSKFFGNEQQKVYGVPNLVCQCVRVQAFVPFLCTMGFLIARHNYESWCRDPHESISNSLPISLKDTYGRFVDN